jgi:hypothetical protein
MLLPIARIINEGRFQFEMIFLLASGQPFRIDIFRVDVLAGGDSGELIGIH